MEAAALLAGELGLVGESCKPLDRRGRVQAYFDEVAIRIAHVASPLITVIIERFGNEMGALGASARLIGHLETNLIMRECSDSPQGHRLKL